MGWNREQGSANQVGQNALDLSGQKGEYMQRYMQLGSAR